MLQSQVGKYQLIRKLAVGGMAEVYLAKAEGPMGFAKTLVLKRILPHLAEDQSFVDMFLGEAKLAAQLNHPNVVQIFDFGEVDGQYYIAMEYIDGPNLRALARRAAEVGQRLPLAHCAKVISFACEGLAFAHDFADPDSGEPLNLIHRDISPDNILLSRNGGVKVVDFGIAKAAGQGHHTKTGTLKGKLAYMPPEQLSAKPLDRRVDIFALGIVLYELLSGEKPFDASSEVNIMRAILYEPLIPVAQKRPEVPPQLAEIVDRALAKDRDQRYGSCRELQADLERFILASGEPVGAYQLSQLVATLAGASGAPAATPAPGSKSRPGSTSNPALPAPQPADGTAVVSPPPGTGSNHRAAATPAPRTSSKPTLEIVDDGAPIPVLDELVLGAAPAAPMPSSVDIRLDDTRFGAVARPPAPPPAPAVRWPLLVGASAVALLLGAGGLLYLKSRASPPSPAVEPGAQAVVQPPPRVEPDPPPQEQPPPPQEVAKAEPPKEEPPQEVAKAEPPKEEAPEQEPTKSRATAKGAKPSRRGTPEKVHQVAAKEAPPQVIAAKAESAPPPPQAALASVEIVSVPPAQIRVNGRFVNMSPARLLNHPTGEIRVEVYDSKAGFSKTQTFTLAAGDNGQKRVVVEQGTLQFRIRPYGTVFLDGRPLGDTPLPPVTVYEGKHQIKIVNRELKVEKSVDFVVRPGENTFKFNLQE